MYCCCKITVAQSHQSAHVVHPPAATESRGLSYDPDLGLPVPRLCAYAKVGRTSGRSDIVDPSSGTLAKLIYPIISHLFPYKEKEKIRFLSTCLSSTQGPRETAQVAEILSFDFLQSISKLMGSISLIDILFIEYQSIILFITTVLTSDYPTQIWCS